MRIDNYEVIKISAGFWLIEDTISRAFLIEGTDKALLVDSTNGSGNVKAVCDVLVGFKPVILINTHADADHIGCNSYFENAYMHPAEFSYYAIKRKEDDAKPLPVMDGQKIDLGDKEFEIIHTPGHTCGSIMLLDRKNRVLIGGDTILERVYVFGLFRNLNALVFSLERIVSEYWESFDVVYGSHRNYCIEKDFILKEIAAAKAHLRGELEGVYPGSIPLEPPDYKPALMYSMGGSSFFDFADRKCN